MMLNTMHRITEVFHYPEIKLEDPYTAGTL